MISYLFNTIFYEPLYNGLIFLVSVIPGQDIGIAIILLTILVKFVILPFTHKGTKNQSKMRVLEPEIKDIKKKYEKDKQEQAKQTMELYKKHGVSPFTGCLTMIVQLPVIMALYWVFWKGLKIDPTTLDSFKEIPGHINSLLLNHNIVYSFINFPAFIKINFLGLIDTTGKSIILALLAGITQYFQIKFSMPGKVGISSLKSTGSIKEDIVKSMSFQMRYILPVFVVVFAYTISAAVALYWVTSNTFSVIHEIIIKREADKLKRETIVDNQ
jgi:YidC/Oxa1 family membrane protein insertase